MKYPRYVIGWAVWPNGVEVCILPQYREPANDWEFHAPLVG